MPRMIEDWIDTSKPVLVTGATGYVAGVLIDRLLQLGYHVHATVRSLQHSQEKYAPLQQLANQRGGKIDFFEADLLKRGSFSKAMAGCGIVFHTASPFLMDNHVRDAYHDLIHPAVQGTENVMQQACQTPTVHRVVLTSSIAAILTNAAEACSVGCLNEDTWNRTATAEHMPYCLSKTLAEQTAWIIAGSQNQFKLVAVNPSYCIGPGVTYNATSESFQLVQKLGSGDWETWLGTPDMPAAVVDVRDVADAHVAAAVLPNASGRYIINGSCTTLHELAALLVNKYSDMYPIASRAAWFVPKWLIWLVIPLFPHLGLDRTFIWNNMNHRHCIDNSKSIRELGMQYRPMQSAVEEMYQQLIDAKVVGPRKWYHCFMTARS